MPITLITSCSHVTYSLHIWMSLFHLRRTPVTGLKFATMQDNLILNNHIHILFPNDVSEISHTHDFSGGITQPTGDGVSWFFLVCSTLLHRQPQSSLPTPSSCLQPPLVLQFSPRFSEPVVRHDDCPPHPWTPPLPHACYPHACSTLHIIFFLPLHVGSPTQLRRAHTILTGLTSFM